MRCPTCGTTQSHPGECDACSDAEVRYFCGDHDPGLWLDGPVCTTCGARFGEAARRPPPARPVGRREPPRPESREPIRRAPDVSRTTVRRPPPRVREMEEARPSPSLEDLLARLSHEGERRRDEVEEMAVPEPPADATRPGVPVVGCLFRVLLFVLLAIVLAVAGLFLLFSGLIS